MRTLHSSSPNRPKKSETPHVVTYDTDTRFDISLHDWQGALWAVRVRPEKLRPTDFDNPFVTAHRLLPRPVIEDWLSGLRLARPGRRNRLSDRLA